MTFSPARCMRAGTTIAWSRSRSVAPNVATRRRLTSICTMVGRRVPTNGPGKPRTRSAGLGALLLAAENVADRGAFDRHLGGAEQIADLGIALDQRLASGKEDRRIDHGVVGEAELPCGRTDVED